MGLDSRTAAAAAHYQTASVQLEPPFTPNVDSQYNITILFDPS